MSNQLENAKHWTANKMMLCLCTISDKNIILPAKRVKNTAY